LWHGDDQLHQPSRYAKSSHSIQESDYLAGNLGDRTGYRNPYNDLLDVEAMRILALRKLRANPLCAHQLGGALESRVQTS
jgi:hypothetical protein